jgi:hypothetical protein
VGLTLLPLLSSAPGKKVATAPFTAMASRSFLEEGLGGEEGSAGEGEAVSPDSYRAVVLVDELPEVRQHGGLRFCCGEFLLRWIVAQAGMPYI